MKTLVILAHPDIHNATVNKRWKKELVGYSDKIFIHELYNEYPDWNIDVKKEQQLLEYYDYIILQFPLYWYSYPPLLKKWLDDVFTYGWAYGSKGTKLKGKTFGLAISVGDKEDNYSPSGSVGFTINEIIAPFIASATHVGARILPCFTVYGASFQITKKEVEESAKRYLEYILTLQ